MKMSERVLGAVEAAAVEGSLALALRQEALGWFVSAIMSGARAAAPVWIASDCAGQCWRSAAGSSVLSCSVGAGARRPRESRSRAELLGKKAAQEEQLLQVVGRLDGQLKSEEKDTFGGVEAPWERAEQ
jgi:hypothetical protein